jgi:serine/threonine-protein kinase RsbT
MRRFTAELSSDVDRLVCAAAATEVGRWIGLSEREVGELAIATAELAGNAVRHGRGGQITIEPTIGPRRGVAVRVVDRGGGLTSPDAWSDGYSEGRRIGPASPRQSGHGLGTGLGAIRRLMTEVNLRAVPGSGTEWTAIKWAEEG